jgi:hypothetical protein
MKERLLECFVSHAKGHVDKHLANVEVLLANPVGVGNNGDIIDERFIMARFSNKIQEEIEKELDEVAKYDALLEMANKYLK